MNRAGACGPNLVLVGIIQYNLYNYTGSRGFSSLKISKEITSQSAAFILTTYLHTYLRLENERDQRKDCKFYANRAPG